MTSNKNANKFELTITLTENNESHVVIQSDKNSLRKDDIYLAFIDAFLSLKKGHDLKILNDLMNAAVMVLADRPELMKELEKTLMTIEEVKKVLYQQI